MYTHPAETKQGVNSDLAYTTIYVITHSPRERLKLLLNILFILFQYLPVLSVFLPYHCGGCPKVQNCMSPSPQQWYRLSFPLFKEQTRTPTPRFQESTPRPGAHHTWTLLEDYRRERRKSISTLTRSTTA